MVHSKNRLPANKFPRGTIEIPGYLEIDETRGVIWFHVDKPLPGKKLLGYVTPLRICGLPHDIWSKMYREGQADVTVLDYYGKEDGTQGSGGETPTSGS